MRVVRSKATPVLVPVKAFDLAKGRLAEAVPPEDRARLAEAMATRVVRAAAPLPVWVICDDPAVARWAVREGVHLLWRAAAGLNHAVEQGRAFARTLGAREIIIAHADLPRAEDLTFLLDAPEPSVIITDREGDGTNVWMLPTGPEIEFAYGPGSADRHAGLAAAVGVEVAIRHHPDLSWDIDDPDDLAGLPDDLLPLADPDRRTE